MAEAGELLKNMITSYEEAVKSNDQEAYLKVTIALERINKELRGYTQKLTLPEMKEVLEKIKEEEPLSEGDLKNLKSWIVGDAQHYIDLETNFDSWNDELTNITAKMKELWTENPDTDRITQLRTLTQDAAKMVANIAFYLKQQASVTRFNAAIQDIGETERMILMSLLQQKISDSKF